MKKIILALAFAFALTLSANAQPYKNAVGVTFGPDLTGGNYHLASLQWKHFLNTKNALDIRAGYQFSWGPEVAAMFEWNFPLGNYGFNFYAGPGVHGGFVTDYNGLGDNCAVFGFTGAVGFEYVFYGIPLALSIDWRPYLTWQPALDNKPNFGYAGLDVGLKYCF